LSGAAADGPRHQFCSPVRWTETQDLLLSEFQTRRTVEIGPAETLTNMMKRTYDTANSISREFLSLKKNRDDVYHVGEEKEADAPRQQEVATRPAPTTETRQLQQQPTPAPASAPASAPAPIAAGPIEDAPVQASEAIRTIVSIALKKPAKDVAFDQSVKALSGGALTRCNLLYSS
jgi:fatty acid synthase subunit alpha